MKKADNLRVGILGGTFDPIHIGHLIIAEEIRVRFNLEKVVFIPAARPPHKDDREVTPAELRYQMTALAIEDNPKFEVSAIELERAGKSYTVDTLRELRGILGESTQIYLIMGADEALEVATWKDPDEVFDLCRVVVVSRPKFDLKVVDRRWTGRMTFATIPEIDVSSTWIRDRVRHGKSIKYLVPSSVERYIQEKGLYVRGKKN